MTGATPLEPDRPELRREVANALYVSSAHTTHRVAFDNLLPDIQGAWLQHADAVLSVPGLQRALARDALIDACKSSINGGTELDGTITRDASLLLSWLRAAGSVPQ